MSQFSGWCSTLPYTAVPREPILRFKLQESDFSLNGQVPLVQCETVAVVIFFGQPQEGNRTKSNFLMRCPFQHVQSSSLQDAGCSVKDRCLGRAAWSQRDAWTRSICFVLQPQAKSASLRSHEQVTGRALVLICSHGPVWRLARRRH